MVQWQAVCGVRPGSGSLGPCQYRPLIGWVRPVWPQDWPQGRLGLTSGGSVSLLHPPSLPPPPSPTVALCPPENPQQMNRKESENVILQYNNFGRRFQKCFK